MDSEKNSLMPTPKSSAANQSAQEGTDHTEQQRHEDAATLPAGEDCLSDGSGDEAQNQKCEKTHFIVPSSFIEEVPGSRARFILLPNTNHA